MNMLPPRHRHGGRKNDHRSKLTLSDVRGLREAATAMTGTLADRARTILATGAWGISRSTLMDILRGNSWTYQEAYRAFSDPSIVLYPLVDPPASCVCGTPLARGVSGGVQIRCYDCTRAMKLPWYAAMNWRRAEQRRQRREARMTMTEAA